MRIFYITLICFITYLYAADNTDYLRVDVIEQDNEHVILNMIIHDLLNSNLLKKIDLTS